MIYFGQRRLIVLSKFFTVWNETTVKLHLPVFVESAQRNSGIVLDNASAVIEQKVADAGKTFAVHEIRSGLDQAHTSSV